MINYVINSGGIVNTGQVELDYKFSSFDKYKGNSSPFDTLLSKDLSSMLENGSLSSKWTLEQIEDFVRYKRPLLANRLSEDNQKKLKELPTKFFEAKNGFI